MKLYYKREIQAAVRAEIKRYNVPKSQTLEVIRRITAERWERASQEVKDEVQEEYNRLLAKAKAEADAPPAPRTPEGYQRYGK